MEILEQSKELTPKELYFLTKSPAAKSLKTVKSQTIEVCAWCLYRDLDSEGKETTLLSLLTKENEIFTSNSKTVQKDFADIWSFFADEAEQGIPVKIDAGMTKAGREYLSCYYDG